jgi:hypothetical protein
VAHVLCTGVDRALLTTRKLLLERGGHTVVTASNERELTDACSRQNFGVAVIGQTVAPSEKRRIGCLLREKCPGAKVLELYSPHLGKLVPDADDWLVVPTEVPVDLAQRVTELARKNANPQKAGE